MHGLGPFDKDGETLNAIVETPKGSRNKYAYLPEAELFELSGTLPLGAVFPFDFGMVPGTLGEDGDPLDVLLLMDEPAFPGCLVRARLIGVVEAEQTERDGETMRNDRLIAVALKDRLYGDAQSLDDIAHYIVEEIEHFFGSYNTIKGKEFKPLGRGDAARARALVQEGTRTASNA